MSISHTGLVGAALVALSASSLDAQCSGAAQPLFEARKMDEARAEAQAQLARDANDATALYCLGRIAAAQDKSGEAVDWFEKALKRNDRSSEYHLWLGNMLGQEAQRASKLRQPFLARRVKAEFERAVELDPRSVDARHGLIQFYSVAPGVMGGSMEKAKAHAAEIGKLNPMRGHIELGALLEREKDAGGAEREYTAGVAAMPDSAAGAYALGSFYQRQKRWDDAFAVYDRVLQANPSDGLARFNYGRAAALSGKNLDRGVRELESLMADPPQIWPAASVAAAHFRLGSIYEQQGKKELARGQYEEAVKRNPKNEDAKKALASLR
jgi:tetratricopeptide (TPR) repeat protein